MLEPREADIPALFLVFIVLPLLAYVLLGKWSEASKKSERISLLGQLASEEALRAEAMAVPDIIPLVSSSKNNVHACARCSRPATTRCSRCKSVRYWQICLQLEPSSATSSPMAISYGESFHNDSINSQYFGFVMEQILGEEAPAENIIYPPIYTGISNKVQCASVDPSHWELYSNNINGNIPDELGSLNNLKLKEEYVSPARWGVVAKLQCLNHSIVIPSSAINDVY